MDDSLATLKVAAVSEDGRTISQHFGRVPFSPAACRSAHHDRAVGQTSVSQIIIRMSSMDNLPAHAAGTALSAANLQALQALAEPNRARIIDLLGHGEHCVCDVGGALGLSSALVSHHLRVLRAAGLVSERPDGRWVHYALDVGRLAELRAALVTLLTATDEAAAACACSDCGPSTPARDRVTLKPLEAVGSGR